MDVARLSQEIPVCQNMVCMNTGISGPSPVRVVEAIRKRLDYGMNQGPPVPRLAPVVDKSRRRPGPPGPAWVRLTVEKDQGNSRRRYYRLVISPGSRCLGLDGGECLFGHSPAVQLPQGHH